MSEEKTVKNKKNKGGRPRIELDETVLANLASLQCTNKEIAFVMGVSVDTLARHYSDIIAVGSAQGKIKLRRAMFRNATEKDNAVMQIWLSKNLLNMTDQPVSDESNVVLPWEDTAETD
tara:strand:- start:1430 stop:1786 length:357 start_codon:yes stop_codon:yes gene_type:complete